MTQSPDEKTYVEIPFIEQLKGIDWDNGEGSTRKGGLLGSRTWEDMADWQFSLEALKWWEGKAKYLQK